MLARSLTSEDLGLHDICAPYGLRTRSWLCLLSPSIQKRQRLQEKSRQSISGVGPACAPAEAARVQEGALTTTIRR